MFDIHDTKTIKDSVHGYISVSKCFFDHIIDTEYFQRLRNIEQTGMRVLYPNAKHDRYCHSLGVFHLGNKAVDALLDNFSQDKLWNISSDHKSILFWAKNKVLFLIACILHDIGHTPFSHSLEYQIYRNSGPKGINDRIAEKIVEYEHHDSSETSNMSIKIKSSASHEQLGALLVLEKMEKNIENIFDDLIAMSYPNINSSNILVSEYYKYNPTIDKIDLKSDLCFIARMILGLKYEDFLPENQIRNCFVELLNGGNFDVDKLDYIIRDTKMSGINNVSIDVERLLNSICIITKTVYKNQIFENDNRFSRVPIHSIKTEENDNASLRITGEFKGSFRFHPNTEVVIKGGSTIESLKGVTGEAVLTFLNDMTVYFTKESDITVDNTPKQASDDFKTIHPNNNNEPIRCIIKNAKLKNDSCFGFKTDNDTKENRIELIINGFCDIKVTGNFSSTDSVVFYKKTTIDGTIEELIVLSDMITDDIPSNNCYNSFSIGFKKQAINIIANVLEARDYLYLWCYAHHKIIYYANFLVPALSASLAPSKTTKKFPCWALKYDDLIYLDDAYMWALFRFIRGKARGEEKKLLEELFTRSYKKSIWKSLAEYDIIFQKFNDKQKMNISNALSDIIREDMPNVKDKDGLFSAGFLKQKFIDSLKQNPEFSGLNCLVYAKAGYSMKKTDVFNTFLLMGKEAVSMDRIQLLKNKDKITQRNTAHYFYLYYDSVSFIDSQKLIEAILKLLENDSHVGI